ncbi:Disease resistance protein TAO1 [Camellia lanceoleosa]|uniref:Disease resistance protein TAO1 n=1 Tax=Camellia lanceoleosa TaxID=1840588 RepID=A0ACC0FQB9_9ERIC|nr:Disease resistance protein TAO1 [Camellia lanceoleosa]
MAETLLFNIIGLVLSKLSSLALDQIAISWDTKIELKKLENTLSTIRDVLLDANEQQATNNEVRDWLEKLQDVVYDVDDLLDDLSTHLLLRKLKFQTNLLQKFHTKAITERVRHVLFQEEDFSGKELPEFLLQARNMRSFSYSFKVGSIGKYFVETIALNFRHMRVLVLISLELEEMPSSIGKLKQLRYLNLSRNCNIRALPSSLCGLVNLQTLNLINCEQLQGLPRDSGKLVNLKRALPSSLCGLVNLQTLNLINCEQLQGLPRDSGKLVNLKTLYLTSKQRFLPDKCLHGLNSLQCLLLYKCDRLALLPEGMHHLTALRVLRIYECPRLASLPSSIKYLTALEKLWIWDCQELTLLEGEGMEGLTSLQSLLLMGLPKLITLPEGLEETAASNLQYLRIANCPSLTALPEWLQNFTALLRLYIEDCPNLSYLPEGVHHLSAKVHINVFPQLNGGN